MTVNLRPALPNEAPALTALSLRSKAYWGYDAAFMRACVDELTLYPSDLAPETFVVATRDETVVGLAQIAPLDHDADLLALFVEPDHMGHGVGRVLFEWSVEAARAIGAIRLMIEADPGAEPFYARMGAVTVGTAPSGSIPGRVLPLMEYRL
ncbi:GNAT family N-acetyltransferase [Roseovarius sp. 2305UL8-3]|uniref:GNAT family N-acetyltransferase n=1 Tax=Roseovarius conchicola TaxID=3121636 RepID=UPI0035279E3F